MSAVFTQHAVERMRQSGVTDRDRINLLEVIEQIARDPQDLQRLGTAIRVGSGRTGNSFIILARDMRAAVRVDPARPHDVIVMSVYHADQVELAHGDGALVGSVQ